MTKINSRLFTVFLIFGIVFFICIIFFISNEIFKETIETKNITHKINLTDFKVVKNEYLDTFFVNKIRNTNREDEFNIVLKDWYCFSFINSTDSSVYAKSRQFMLKSLEETSFVDFANSKIPYSSLQDSFEVKLISNGKVILDFGKLNLIEKLQITNKNNNILEIRDIKLTSIDKKVIGFLSFNVE